MCQRGWNSAPVLEGELGKVSSEGTLRVARDSNESGECDCKPHPELLRFLVNDGVFHGKLHQ